MQLPMCGESILTYNTFFYTNPFLKPNIMKKIKAMVLACALLCGLSAAAQFSTGGSSSSSSNGENSDYNQIGLSYVNESFSFDYPKDSGFDKIGANGFGLKYIHGFSVSKSLPMFVETGLSFNFNVGSKSLDFGGDYDYDYGYDDDYDYDYAPTVKYQHAALAVPVNFAYKFNINENFAVKPYLGLNFKFNILGRQKIDYGYDDDYDYDYYAYDDDYYDEDMSDRWSNLYSKKDMDSLTWNRFQMGWQIGADVQFKKFFLGLEYGTDFIKAQSKKQYGEKFNVNSGTFKLSIGYCF